MAIISQSLPKRCPYCGLAVGPIGCCETIMELMLTIKEKRIEIDEYRAKHGSLYSCGTPLKNTDEADDRS